MIVLTMARRTQALTHNISINVSDGDSFCDQSRLLSVTCVADACVSTCDDGNQCTDDGVCDPVSGCPGSTDSPAGTACDFATVGDGLCDGAGACVECLTATDCTGGVCNGSGLCVECVAAGDCTDDGTELHVGHL